MPPKLPYKAHKCFPCGFSLSTPPYKALQPALEKIEKLETKMKPAQKEKLEAFVGSKLIFDMSCHYFNYMQETEGMEALAKAMSVLRPGRWGVRDGRDRSR